MNSTDSIGHPKNRDCRASDKFTSEEHHIPDGSVDEDNTLLNQGKQNEPESEPQFGEDGAIESVDKVDISDGDSLVNVDQIIENFKKLAGMRLRGTTPRRYEHVFRRFDKTVNLEQYNKKQLAGSKGKELLLQYLLDKNKVPEPSKRVHNAALKTFWEDGLGIPYPINIRKHLGELPPVQRRQSPKDSDVLPWINAIEHEEEPYLRVLALMIFQLGVRPSHACLFRWKHINYGLDGRPESIITTGREPGNKKMTPVKARLPPDLSDALSRLKSTINAMPEDPILPHRRPSGRLEHSVSMPSNHYWAQWLRFEKKHQLNHLRPVDLRHWVATTCRKAGLSMAARNALQGHKFSGENQGERYDNPQDIDILEEQARVLPYGPIGFICPKMEVTQALPVELTDALGSCLKGDILISQLMEKVTAYLLRQIKKPENTMVA